VGIPAATVHEKEPVLGTSPAAMTPAMDCVDRTAGLPCLRMMETVKPPGFVAGSQVIVVALPAATDAPAVGLVTLIAANAVETSKRVVNTNSVRCSIVCREGLRNNLVDVTHSL
jgi:hypothetical protein